MTLEPLLRAIAAGPVDGSRVREWSIYASESRRATLGVKDREVGNAHAPFTLTEASGARYLFVWQDGKISRGSFERAQFESAPHDALTAARAAAYEDPDAARVLGPATIPDVPLHDAAAAEAACGRTALLEQRLEWIRSNFADWGSRTWSGSFAAAETHVVLTTSAGLETGGRGTSFGWHVTLNGQVGDGHGARAPDSADAFEQRLRGLVETARRLAEKAEAMPSGVRPVILHPDVVERLVIGTLLHHLDGSTVAHGEGRFRREQFGSDDPVLREDLLLRLDPLQPLRSGSYRFTVEGLPADRCSYIEAGRLVQPLLDLKYARRLDLPPTPMPYDADSLYLEGPEPLTESAALEAAAGGALILSVLGLHTQDQGSGDFSLSAPQALSIGPKGYAGGLRATLSGNLFDLLRDPATRLVDFPREHTPGMLVHCRIDPK